jgi:hypothetical protein
MTRRGHKEISGRSRLAELGPVFTKQDLIFRFGTGMKSAEVMLSRWHHQYGYVRLLGGRSQVYFNLLKDPNWHAHFETALKLAVPHAITMGQSAYSHGWISQPPNARHLAVPVGVQLYTIDGCQFHYRRRDWFIAIAPGVQYKEHTIPELRPAWALADALFAKSAYQAGRLSSPATTNGSCGVHSVVPDPDDLYVDDSAPRDVRDFAQAAERLKNYYGFTALTLVSSCSNFPRLYASVHSAVLGHPNLELAASPEP